LACKNAASALEKGRGPFLFEQIVFRGPILVGMLPLLQPLPHLAATELPMGITDVQLALLISGGAIIFVIQRWRRNAVNRRNASAGSNSRASASEGQVASPRAASAREVTMEVDSLLGEVEETARRLTAQIDNRYQRLELLIAEADEKIRRLEALTGKAVFPSDVPAPSRAAQVSSQPPQAALAGAVVSPAPAQGTMIKAAQREALPAVTENERALTRLRQERGAPPAAQDPAYQPIYTLSDLGKSAREIAQQLQRQPGEIELILALRQQA